MVFVNSPFIRWTVTGLEFFGFVQEGDRWNVWVQTHTWPSPMTLLKDVETRAGRKEGRRRLLSLIWVFPFHSHLFPPLFLSLSLSLSLSHTHTHKHTHATTHSHSFSSFYEVLFLHLFIIILFYSIPISRLQFPRNCFLFHVHATSVRFSVFLSSQGAFSLPSGLAFHSLSLSAFLLPLNFCSSFLVLTLSLSSFQRQLFSLSLLLLPFLSFNE